MSFVGYDPTRIGALAHRTRWAIDEVRRLQCGDPAAAAATDDCRRLLRTLESEWMPLLDAIARSDAMRGFTVVGRSLDIGLPSRRFFVAGDGRCTKLDGDALLAELWRRVSPVTTDAWPFPDEHLDGSWETTALSDDDAALGREVAARMMTDDAFRATVLTEISTTPGLALWLPADLPGEYRVAVAEQVVAVLATPLGIGTFTAAIAALEHLLGTIVDEPERCFVVMQSTQLRRALIEWPALDQDLVAAVTARGMRYAFDVRPELLPHGQQVFRALVADSADLDEFGVGVTLGLADAMAAIAPTFVSSIEGPGTPAFGADSLRDPFATTALGTYDDLVRLCGALLRRPEGQAGLGVTVATMSTRAVRGDPIVTVDAVAEFGVLLGVAARREDREYELEAAATQAAISGVTQLVANGAATGAAMAGAPVVSSAIGPIVNGIGRRVASTVRPETTGAPPFLGVTRAVLRVAVIRELSTDPTARHEAGVDHVDEAVWTEVAASLDRLDLTDPDLVTTSAQVLHEAELRIRAAGGGAYLDGILERPSTHELTRPPFTD